MYGHVRVVLGRLAAHPAWGVVALPLLARRYVRRMDLDGIAPAHRPAFRTQRELAAELMRWAVTRLGFLGKPLWVAADGAHAKAPFLTPMRSLGVTVVRRLRRDSNRRTVPVPRPGRRGRPRVYGEGRIDLAKRGGQRRGWATGTFALYGKPTAKRYKTFVATWRPAGGATRVVRVDGPTGWVALCGSDPTAGVADTPGTAVGRFGLGVTFRDLRDVVGAGQQEVRRVPASVGAFHACPWALAMTEAWAWGRDAEGLVGRRAASPRGDAGRRPGHVDQRRAWRRERRGKGIRAVLRPGPTEPEIRAAEERLRNLAA